MQDGSYLSCELKQEKKKVIKEFRGFKTQGENEELR